MIYDFMCEACGEISEILCSSKDINKQKCKKCNYTLSRLYIAFPEFCKGVGSDTRLSDIAPNDDASDEVKTKFKKMLRTKPINPLKIKTKG